MSPSDAIAFGERGSPELPPQIARIVASRSGCGLKHFRKSYNWRVGAANGEFARFNARFTIDEMSGRIRFNSHALKDMCEKSALDRCRLNSVWRFKPMMEMG